MMFQAYIIHNKSKYDKKVMTNGMIFDIFQKWWHEKITKISQHPCLMNRFQRLASICLGWGKIKETLTEGRISLQELVINPLLYYDQIMTTSEIERIRTTKEPERGGGKVASWLKDVTRD
jgi:hypothetical protein